MSINRSGPAARRGRRRPPLPVVALLSFVVIALAAWWVRLAVEVSIGGRLRRAGMSAGAVRFSWWGPLTIEDVRPSRGPAVVDRVSVYWRIVGGASARTHVSRIVFHGLRAERTSLAVSWADADFDVAGWTDDGRVEQLVLRQHGGDGRVELTRTKGADDVLQVERLSLEAADVRWNGDVVSNLGRWTGCATLAGSPEHFETQGAFHGDAVQMTAPRTLQPGGAGVATTAEIEWKLHGGAGTVDVERVRARLAGLELEARGSLRGATSREMDLRVKAHGDLADAFRTVGLPPPLADVREGRVAAVALDLEARGPVGDPASITVDSRVRVKPEPEVVQALSYLRGPFVHRPEVSPGIAVDVSEGAPDFIAIGDVPPLFLRTLLISEDAGFWHHAGIDLAEIVAAWVANEEDGRRVRGASTITQQLVKNVLLSSERTYGRKLNEAALALLVDAVVSKPRLLEIYVNIIEWGPRLHGLVPAARHYFGKRPAELTPKEIAFLVCLIPNPVRYHQAHASGKLGPGMEQLVRNLLAKVHSVGALSDDEYEQVRNEELCFAPEVVEGF